MAAQGATTAKGHFTTQHPQNNQLTAKKIIPMKRTTTKPAYYSVQSKSKANWDLNYIAFYKLTDTALCKCPKR